MAVESGIFCECILVLLFIGFGRANHEVGRFQMPKRSDTSNMATRHRALGLPQPWVLAALTGLAFAIRTIDALRRPFHTDERISLQWGTFPVKDMLQILRTVDVHPPFFFLLLHVSGLAHAPLWMPRMLMVAFGTASVVLLYFIVRMWAGDPAASIAALCAAFMPILIFYDTWIRMYALSDALTLVEFLLLSIILTRTDLTSRRRWLLWALWSAAAVLAGYTLYLAWFAVLAQILYVLCLRRDRLLEASVSFAGAILLWTPQVPALLHQLGMGGQTFAGYRGHEVAGLLSLAAQATVVPQLEGTFANVAAALVWLWLGAALWATIVYAGRSLLPWLGMPALLTFLYGVATHKLLYLDRYYIFLAYALAAWTGCLFALAMERRLRAVVLVTASFIAGIIVLGAAYALDPSFYTADWPGVAQVLSREEQQGDLVLAEQGMPFWTLPGDKDILSHPHLFIFYANQIPKALNAAKQYRRVWVIVYEPRGIDPNLVLLGVLGKEYHLTSVHQFNRYLPAEDVVVLRFER